MTAEPKAFTAEPNTDAWLDERLLYIGSSEVCAHFKTEE